MDKLVNVKFKECTREEYDAMQKHANNVVYSCYDTGELFKGDIQFSEGSGGGGGLEEFVVTYEFNSEESAIVSADKTFEEIQTAYSAGKLVKAKTYFSTDSEWRFYQLERIDRLNIIFSVTSLPSEVVYYKQIIHYDDNTYNYTEVEVGRL